MEIVTPEGFEKLLSAVKAQPFRDVLVVSYDTGLRPQELKIIEAWHIQIEKQRAVIPGSEAKGSITRTTYFATELLEVVRRLCTARQSMDGIRSQVPHGRS
jgi:integrase